MDLSTRIAVTRSQRAFVPGPPRHVSFGALTPAGHGGIPTSASAITSGDLDGHWEVSGGALVPTAAGAGTLVASYALGLNNGDQIDVTVMAGRASARPEEIAAVYAALPATAGGILVRAGDGRGVGRIVLPPRVWSQTFILEPEDWTEMTDPRSTMRTSCLAGISVGGSVEGAQTTENLTIQGFVFHIEAGGSLPAPLQSLGTGLEAEDTLGVVAIESPSRQITVRQCEIWSRSTSDIVAADDYVANVVSARQLRGVTTRHSAGHPGRNGALRLTDNYIHDVARGAVMTQCDADVGTLCAFSRNVIRDVYTHFLCCQACDGLEVLDNRALGVLAADVATDGTWAGTGAAPVPALVQFEGGSGLAAVRNISVLGNVFAASAACRETLSVDAGDAGPRSYTAAGLRIDAPDGAESTHNVTLGFNLLSARGPALILVGVDADVEGTVDVFHNTLVGSAEAQQTDTGAMSLAGVQKLRLWQNIAAGYRLGSGDGDGALAASLDDLTGYANRRIVFSPGPQAVDFDATDYFVGPDGDGIIAQMELDTYETAFMPKLGSGAMGAAVLAGALGTGLYAQGGQHSAVYDKPMAQGGVEAVLPTTYWDGSVHLAKADILAASSVTDATTFLFAWEGALGETLSGDVDLLSFAQGSFALTRLGTGQVQLRVVDPQGGPLTLMQATSAFTVMPAEGITRIAASYDMATGRVQFVKNGVLDSFTQYVALDRAAELPLGFGPFRLHADTNGGTAYQGMFGRAYFTATDVFHDLETHAGLSALFAQDGTFRDWGTDGGLVTGTVPLVYVSGTAANLQNTGTGGTLQVIGGTVSDEMASVQFNTSDTVIHQGRAFTVTRASDGADVDWFTALDGSPVVISYGEPVTVTAQMPSSQAFGTFDDGTSYTDRTIDGMVLNPGNYVDYSDDGTVLGNFIGEFQGFDSAIHQTFEPSLNNNSYTITQGTVVQATSLPSPRERDVYSKLASTSIVHVVENPPATLEVWRSGQSSPTTGLVEGKDLVDAYIAGLSTLPPPPSWGSFNISAAIAHWQTPENPSHIYMARGRELYPGDRADLSGVGYGRGYAIFVSRSLRALYTSTYGLAFRQALAVAMVQAGIDLHDRTFNQGGEYYADGGLNNGRWPLVAFAASVLDDDEMLANISGTGAVRGIENKFRWQELGIAYRYEADDVNDRREIIRPSASSAPGTGYQVGDIVTPLNGVALNDTPPTFRVMAVDGAGGITDLDVETQGYYWITPRQEWPDQNSAWPLTGGSGTGAELTLRETQLAHPGLTGQLGWADNIYDRRFPNPVNTSLAQSYRHINLNAALAVAITMRMLPDMQADVDAVDFFALCDALYWNDDGPSGSITPAWVLEDWASYRGFNQTGVPVVTGAETSTDGKLLWLTFDRDLKQSYAARARPADVVVRVNGVVAPRPVDGMHVNGHNVLLLALNTPVAQGDTVTVSYAPGPAPLRFQDLTGNALAAFTDQAVVNMVQ